MHYIGVNLSKTTPLPSDRESEFSIYRLNSKVHVAMYLPSTPPLPPPNGTLYSPAACLISKLSNGRTQYWGYNLPLSVLV